MILRKEGFSLIEVLIGTIFLAIGVLAIASLQVTSVRGNFFSNNLMQATYVAQDRLEFLKSLELNDPLLGFGNHPDGTTTINTGLTFSRSYSVDSVFDPNGNYLSINYSVQWNDGVAHSLSFSTRRSE